MRAVVAVLLDVLLGPVAFDEVSALIILVNNCPEVLCSKYLISLSNQHIGFPWHN